MRFSKSSFFAVFFYGLLGLCFILQSYNDALRHLKYAIPVVLLAGYLTTTSFKKKIKLDDYLLQQLKMYGIMVIWSLIVLAFKGVPGRYFQEVYFVLSPLITLFLLHQISSFEELEKKVDIIFCLLIAANIIYTGPAFFNFFSSPSSLQEELLTSTSSTESPYAFDFGLFTLYYFLRGRKLHAVMALLFSVIAFKRIVLLGFFAAGGLLFLLRKQRSQERRSPMLLWMVTLINLVLVINIYLFSKGDYDDLIEQWFGVSGNYLSQGRYILYQGIFEMIQTTTLLTGMGFGSITHYLLKTEAFLNNLHSDVLKVFLEFGVFFFVYWIYQFYKKTFPFLPVFLLSVFINVLFLTDNVFVYYDVMLFYYLFVLLLRKEFLKRTESQSDAP